MESQIRPRFSPRDFFIQLGEIVALYVSVVFFLTLVFSLLNIIFPEGDYWYYQSEAFGLRMGISALIVAYPLFVYFTRIVKNDERKNGGLQSGFRRWLLYFTLFVTGVTIAVDVIVLINTFLNGDEFTLRFSLKCLVVLVVAIKIFYYYLCDIRGKWISDSKTPRFMSIVWGIIILSLFVWGFILVGGPNSQRLINNDSNRVMDLQNIQVQIVNFYQHKGEVPASLKLLEDPISGFVVPVDPITSESYEYQFDGKTNFTLCATFESSSESIKSERMYPIVPGVEEVWNHGVGRTCFNRNIDPNLYPQVKN